MRHGSSFHGVVCPVFDGSNKRGENKYTGSLPFEREHGCFLGLDL
ncbi:hypothetical protein OROHE_019359 [Orobanche hederae]